MISKNNSLRKRISGLIGIAIILTALSATIAAAVPFQNGDVFAGVGNGQIRHYDKNGTFIENLTVPSVLGQEDTGMAFDSSGNLYATVFGANKVAKFNNTGAFLGFFGSGYNADPESIVFDATGNVFVGQADGTRKILKFDSTGIPLANFTPATENRGTDWIDLASDQCTIYYSSEGTHVKRFNVCTNTQLADFASGLHGAAFALRILPNGGVLVGDSQDAHRLNASGNIVQTYPKPVGETSFLFALNLDPDGTSFWTAGYSSGKVYKIDIATGNLLLTINTTDQGSIVTLAGLAIFGEPTAAKPSGKPGKVIGWGDLGTNASFNIWVYSNDLINGRMDFTDKVNKVSIKGTNMTSVTTNMLASPKTGTITGLAYVIKGANKGNHMFQVDVIDKAFPSHGQDILKISVPDLGYSMSGPVTFGDINVVK